MIAWSVTTLRVLPGYRLEVSFADGLKGIVDMSQDNFSGVFAPLADESYFALATIRDGGWYGRTASISRQMRCMTK